MPKERMSPRELDFTVYDGGSLFIVTPRTDAAREHLDQVLDEEAQRWGNGVAVEHRYLESFVHQLVDDGFSVIAGGRVL
jgi:hypothetical protein